MSGSQALRTVLSALAFAFLAGLAAAQSSLGIGALRKPVDVIVKNATAFPITVGFSKFVGYDEQKDCVEEVFELGAGQAKSFASVAYSPCFYYAEGKGKALAWGGKLPWFYQGFPGNDEGNVFSKPFFLDQGETEGGTRTITLSEANAWISDPVSYASYWNFMRYASNWFNWKFMVEFLPCGPNEERSLEAVNRSSSPLRLFALNETYGPDGYPPLSSALSYQILPSGGKTAFMPRTGLPQDGYDALALSASQEPGPLYWHGMEYVRCKRSDFGGVAAPKMAYMPLIKGHKTVMTFTDAASMGSGRYRFMILNRSSIPIDVDVWYAPYPGDSGRLSKTIPAGGSAIIVSPNPEVSYEGRAVVGRTTYTWTKTSATLKDENAYGSCDSVTLTWSADKK